MNLKKMLEGSNQNLSWLGDKTTYQPKDLDTNQKDDLEMQWGYGEFDPTYNIPAENPKPVQSNESDVVVRTAKVLLMRGLMGKRFVAAMRDRFGDVVLAENKDKVVEVLENEGILGCIAVDPKGLKDCKDAFVIAAKSPNAKHIRYVLACDRCAGCEHFKTEKISVGGEKSNTKINKASIDDFFLSNNPTQKLRSFCSKTGHAVLVSRGDLDESELDSTFIDLVNGGALTKEEAKLIRSQGDAFTQAKRAFVLIERKHRKAEESKYASKVDTTEFKIEASDNPVVISDAIKTKKQDVKTIRANMKSDVELATMKSGVDVDPVDYKAGMEIVVPKDSCKGSLVVDKGTSDIADFDILSEKTPKSLDIDCSTFKEKEFEDCESDVIETSSPNPQIDVDMTPDLTI